MALRRIMQFSLWLIVSVLGGLHLSGAHALVGTPVASVGLSVGPVFRQLGNSTPQRVYMGQALFEGDRLITGPDAMALLVFSDDARVSLRADSELRIIRYRVAAAGQSADLRLELVKGAMRQISGASMKREPERYRLNTPVAAIGVRGTDFLAKASDQAIETFIQEGVIVLLPLGNGCAVVLDSRQCTPIASLSDADALRYITLTATGNLERRGVQPQELERLFGIRMARSLPSQGTEPATFASSSVSSQAPVPVSSSSDLAAARASETLDQKTAPPPAQPPEIAQPPVVVDLPPVTAQPPEIAQPPVVVDPPPVVLPTQLVWGRFSSAGDLPLKLPLSYEDASSGRHVTVGELGQYALWRQGANGPIDSSLRGVVSYNFVAGEASFQAAGLSTLSTAELRTASLSINFDRSAFDSSFSVFHAATGDIQIAASGRLNDEGLFSAVNGTARVAGAVSRDGEEAGALFSKEVSTGTVRGISLWRARP